MDSMDAGVPSQADPSINQLFNDVLSAFAGFTNQMPHWLKSVLGEGTATVDVFRTACSQEYDRAFEYRLLHNLQNESRHRTDVLHVTYNKKLGESGRVEASISDQILDHALSDKSWQARVRKEITARTRPIDAIDLLAVLRGCALRIYLRSLLGERDAIEKDISTIQVLADGIECEGDLAFVSRRSPPPGSPTARLVLTIANLELRAAEMLKKAVADAERIVWPRFAVQVSSEWLEQPASNALLGVLATDPTIHAAAITLVEAAGLFVGVTAPSAYAAESAVTRAIERSGIHVQDERRGPAIPLP